MCKQAIRWALVILVIACVLATGYGEIGILAFHVTDVAVPIMHHVVTVPEIPHPITMHPVIHIHVIHTFVLTQAERHAIHLQHLKHLEHVKYLAYLRHSGK